LLRQVGDKVAVLVHHRGVANHQSRVRAEDRLLLRTQGFRA
jgi:hypothetical protein